jgi:hypothetical protein
VTTTKSAVCDLIHSLFTNGHGNSELFPPTGLIANAMGDRCGTITYYDNSLMGQWGYFSLI